MKLLLGGRWPPLKPLPVFKFETDTHRASIEFDKMRGEWICRKTSLPSNKIQELRGGLAEIIGALTQGKAAALLESAAAVRQEYELDKDANRRFQAMREWKENFENGALYSGLRNNLPESQQKEMDEIIRLTLTARQLQFNPKNVAYVFDALSKAGGKLATLLEIAKRNKAERETGAAAIAEAGELDAGNIEPGASPGTATLESFPEEPVWSDAPEQPQLLSPEQFGHASSQASEIVKPEILQEQPPSIVEDIQEMAHHDAPVADLRPQGRTRKVAWPASLSEFSPSPQRALEISGLHVAAFAFVFLFAVISLPLGLTVGRGPLGQWLRATEESIFPSHATSPALPAHPPETTSQDSAVVATNASLPSDASTSGDKLDDAASFAEKPQQSATDSETFANAHSNVSISAAAIEAKKSDVPGSNRSAGLIERNVPPPASLQPKSPPEAFGPISGALGNLAPRGVAPRSGGAPRRSPPAAILVTAPTYGSKPFRVSFPAKPIAASSSFAMTSELSVLVPPQDRLAAAHRPARLQAGELVSYVWPRYSRRGDRYGSAETVKARILVGPSGVVQDIKLMSGSTSLFPATISAIRQWRYTPTLMNQKPVQAQQDVTIEFRPPQNSSKFRRQHPSHK
ncbi:MAG TPA: energy transducer TonB [Candidatus Acidoferrum sp.]|nr:energy transducer TonB [Candidatus Acidoferrum sp.]